MPSDLRPGPDSPPADELASAEASLAALQQVLHILSRDDTGKPTPCPEFNVRELTEHLLHSVMVLGHMVGAQIVVDEDTDTVERLVIGVARPALDAWHRHGLDGDVPLAQGSMAARTAVSVFSVEFLVHGWDYATAVGQEIKIPDSLAEYVLGLAQKLIKPHERRAAGFDDPVGVPDEASALDRLVAFTGRKPVT